MLHSATSVSSLFASLIDKRWNVVPLLGVFALASACGGQVTVVGGTNEDGDPSTGGSTTGPGNPTGPDLPEPKPTMSVRAPTQYSIELTFNMDPPPEAFDANSYTIDGEYGGVTISSIQSAAQTIVRLDTDKQKLGVHFDLTFHSTGDWDGLTANFPSADTAVFWTADLNDPAFAEYQLTADRRTIGDHVVIYVEQGMSAGNSQQTATYFDDEAYPIETAMFNAAPDRDGNDRILLLGLNGFGAYGGYFNSMDTLTDAQAMSQWGMHSNEMEMLYINVESGQFDTTKVVAHELSHLLYQEAHGMDAGWSWHNEGMAECATHAVHGENDYDAWYYTEDPQGGIQTGLSLINWQFANFDQYVLSYLFLTYIAGQKDGIPSYGELFQLEGSPASVETWIQQNLGITFSEAHKRQLLATWAQQPLGVYSYNGMVTFPGKAPVGTGTLTLEPFSGAFRQPASPVSYPGTQGPDVIYVGINSLGEIDETDPFDITGGALLVFNTSTNVNNLSPQPTGNPMPALGHGPLKAEVHELTRVMTRLHPPPLHPERLDELRQWQLVAHAH